MNPITQPTQIAERLMGFLFNGNAFLYRQSWVGSRELFLKAAPERFELIEFIGIIEFIELMSR
jgi:hypothetical protein